jgi:hypothetical protein
MLEVVQSYFGLNHSQMFCEINGAFIHTMQDALQTAGRAGILEQDSPTVREAIKKSANTAVLDNLPSKLQLPHPRARRVFLLSLLAFGRVFFGRIYKIRRGEQRGADSV